MEMPETIYFSKFEEGKEKRKKFTLKILEHFKGQIQGKVFIKPNMVSYEETNILITLAEHQKRLVGKQALIIVDRLFHPRVYTSNYLLRHVKSKSESQLNVLISIEK